MSEQSPTPTGWRVVAGQLLAYAVAMHGLVIIGVTLHEQLMLHGFRHQHISSLFFSVPLLVGLSLLYLSMHMRRRKKTAWATALLLYSGIIGLDLVRLILVHEPQRPWAPTLILPLALIVGLWYFRDDFTVKSDLRSFAFSLRFIALVLSVAFVYGVAGFMLLDVHDFRQEISLPEAIHRTIDQFDLTTNHALVPYTRRARVFMDSLSVISTGAVVFGVVSFFQPVRARLIDQAVLAERAKRLLREYPASSEDFFKLWPHDKLYFFNEQHTAGLAYAVFRGVALVVGDPFGQPKAFNKLLASFSEFCRTNDWLPSFVHTEPRCSKLYERQDFTLQKIGEEAIVDITHYESEVAGSKYFRQITNKFVKQDYTTELLTPPHNDAVISRLKSISQDWLKQPGRAERRFLLGYFSSEYMQQCPVMVLRDAAGTIQAFMNQVDSFDPAEANFDLLRHTSEAPGNSNDYLLMQFIAYARAQGFKRLNLGLCPLSGLDNHDNERSVVGNALRFLYANGDRFYSFSGLYRFKAKYQPVWSARYIAYPGGLRNCTRIVRALSRALKI